MRIRMLTDMEGIPLLFGREVWEGQVLHVGDDVGASAIGAGLAELVTDKEQIDAKAFEAPDPPREAKPKKVTPKPPEVKPETVRTVVTPEATAKLKTPASKPAQE